MTMAGTTLRSSSKAACSSPNMVRRIALSASRFSASCVLNSRPSGQYAVSRSTSSSMMCS